MDLNLQVEEEKDIQINLLNECNLDISFEPIEDLEFILESEEELNILINDEEEIDISMENDVIKVISDDVEKYEGIYDITPQAFQNQELYTKDKLLKENITVKEIPFFETSNQYGNTIYIGSEVC